MTDRRLSVDLEKQRALTSFYREEFARQIEHLQASGLLDNRSDGPVARACRLLIEELDVVASRSQFPAIAETILARFETLTHLGRLGSRRTN